MGKSLSNGKYIIEQELGRGGFGITYKATNSVLGQTVVVKTLNEALQQDPNFLTSQRQFQEEARRLARFAHPHIVRVSDFFTEDGLPYIVMDYIPGQTLDTLVLPDHPLPEAVALHYIRQASEAVNVVHQNGLLHRDIKPQNLILRQGTQQVVLIDFGISREFTPGLTQAHTHFISEGYAPIEQYLPQAKRTPATDVYGLAATLYALLTAQVPIAATLRDRLPLTAPREIRPELSAMVSEAVMRGMAMEPHHRPASVDEWLALLPDPSTQHPAVVGALSSSSQAATIAVAPVHPPVGTKAATIAVAPSPKSVGSRPWLIPLVGLAAVVAAMLGYALSRSLNPSSEPATQTPTTISPSSIPESEAPSVIEEAEPSSTSPSVTEEVEPSSTASPQASDEPATTNESPVPDDLAPLAEPAPPSPDDLAPLTEPAPPSPDDLAPVESEPNPRDPEAAREAEALRRAEEQTREEQKRAEEQAREAQRRAEEQAREEQKREEERRKEEERETE